MTSINRDPPSPPPLPPPPPPPPPPSPKPEAKPEPTTTTQPERADLFSADTLSLDTGDSQRVRSQQLATGGVVAPAADTTAPATTLLTEDTRDAQRNCLDAVGDWLELATPQLRARSEVLLLSDTRPGAEGTTGHAVIRQGESIFDPSTGRSYASLQQFNAEGHYEVAHATSGAAMQRVLSTPPGSPERQTALDAARIPTAVQGMLLADAPRPTGRALTQKEQAALDEAVRQLPEYPSAEDIGAIIDGQDAFWLASGEQNPKALAALTTAMVSRYAPTRGPDADLNGFTATMYRLSEATQGFTPEMSAALAKASVNLTLARRNLHTGEIASWAMQSATTPEAAKAVLDAVGPKGMEQFVTSLGINAKDFNDPLFINSGTRTSALRDFMKVASALPVTAGVPNGAQASFFLTVAKKAGPQPLVNADFREALGKGLGVACALGDRVTAGRESARMGALLRNEHIGDLLQSATAEQRNGLLVAFLDNPRLDSRLVDHHGGNLATAVAFTQLQGVTQGMTGGFGTDGRVPTGPDGVPLILPDAQVSLPRADVLARHPAVARLGSPLYAGTVAQAVQSGRITSTQAANYLDDLAKYSRDLANPDLSRYGGDPFTDAAINILNGGNPIIKSRLNEYAGLNADSLTRLASLVRNAKDPAYVAQAMTAGSAQDATFRASLPRYGDAIAAMGEQVQGRRRAIIAGVGMVAAVAAPILAAAAVPAGATLTIGGVTLGTATLQASAAGLTTSVVSTALNASNQYETTGQVKWANAVAGGAVDGLTTYFGLRMSVIAAARGQGAMSAAVRGATVDGLGSMGAYVLGTPGALEGIFRGDTRHLTNAAVQGGLSAATSFGLSKLLDLPGVDTVPRPGNVVMDGVGVFVPMPRFGAGAAGSRVHGFRGMRDISLNDLDTLLTSGLHPRSVREGRLAAGAIENQPFFQRFWHGVQESAGMNVGENVVMLTRNPNIAENWAKNTPVNSQGSVGWMNFGRFVASMPRPTRAEYFSPQQFQLLRSELATAGGTPLFVKDSTGRTVEMSMDQVKRLMGNRPIDVTVEVAAPIENQVGFGSFYLSPSHQEEPIVGSVGADGILGVTILYDGRLP
jgi:hypothetical protein